MRFFEYKLVPLLMVSMQAADDVAISAMTRGMEVGQKRSTISTAQLRVQDYIVLLLLGILIILFIKVKYA